MAPETNKYTDRYHLGFMAVLGAAGWLVLLAPSLVPGLVAPVQPTMMGWPFVIFAVVIVLARSQAFRPLPGTVISPDSAFFVAALLCFGSVSAGRMVALALTVDAAVRMVARARSRSPRPWPEAALYVAYFGAMSGALLAVLGRLFDADAIAASLRDDRGLILQSVVFLGVSFVVAHYAIQGIRIRLAGQRAVAYVTRMGLPGVLAEISLLPLASVVVFIYEPSSPLGLILLGGTYVLITFGFKRLSRASGKLRKRVVELETIGLASSRLAACRHSEELLEAVASATCTAIPAASELRFAQRLADGTVSVEVYSPADGELIRGSIEAVSPLFDEVLTCDETVWRSDEKDGSWLGAPVRVYGAADAVLALTAPEAGAFDSDDRGLLEGIAMQTSVALQNVRHYELAMVDGLTGLYVRRYFDARLDEEVERTRRYKTCFAVAMLDIDDFKKLNDGYGHDVGDAALREVARIVRDEMRGIDTAARYGGEEIAMVMPRTSLTDAYALAERVRSRLAETPLTVSGAAEPVVVTASIGVAAHPESGASEAEELLRRADRALYRAKRTGKNRVELYWDESSAGVKPPTVRSV